MKAETIIENNIEINELIVQSLLRLEIQENRVDELEANDISTTNDELNESVISIVEGAILNEKGKPTVACPMCNSTERYEAKYGITAHMRSDKCRQNRNRDEID